MKKRQNLNKQKETLKMQICLKSCPETNTKAVKEKEASSEAPRETRETRKTRNQTEKEERKTRKRTP
jgi:Fe-S-cluster-containing hydrogenase component 2